MHLVASYQGRDLSLSQLHEIQESAVLPVINLGLDFLKLYKPSKILDVQKAFNLFNQLLTWEIPNIF